MTDYPKTPGEVDAFMEGLEFSDEPVAEVPPASADVMVTRSLRMPLTLDARTKAAADARGVTVSQLVREWIELELAALENDEPVSRADVLRVVASLHPVRRSA